jgi:tetratricopeptide (TPR) repeat protein
VEILYATTHMDLLAKMQTDMQASAFFGFFSLKHLDTKLLEQGGNPVLQNGAAIALRGAASSGNREQTFKLISLGADPDLAIRNINELITLALKCMEAPSCKESYDKSIQTIALLNEVRGEARKAGQRRSAEQENEITFQSALRAYQTAKVKPQLSEDVRRFKVQAEGAVRDKDFSGAVDLYDQALKIAPWWPEGHFNRALVLGETKEFETAIIEMKRYLVLAPNASNARAAQDKIYDWERKAGK